ncbi:hypothetical protein HUS23_10880 [Ectothiorhodospiraceae bacterium 2226]|nr:hypothetical protein HUS23_10880 [Ectothiorhodospiraceae bacterium 2226]
MRLLAAATGTFMYYCPQSCEPCPHAAPCVEQCVDTGAPELEVCEACGLPGFRDPSYEPALCSACAQAADAP